jgi:hypothetical protein
MLDRDCIENKGWIKDTEYFENIKNFQNIKNFSRGLVRISLFFDT